MRTCERCLFNGAFFTTTCSRCLRERESYVDRFTGEYMDAKEEFERLRDLFKDVCWYNFEAHGKWWGKRKRWVYVHAQRFRRFRRGSLREIGEFPVYYSGPADEAPRLPPAIVLVELEKARKHMQDCRELMTAPIDWAPGGAKYEALRRVTRVGRSFSSED
tara:strand:- start:1216 stop:1698 length:483 start_codon:yes stop_codon:yes gene_type:complete